MKATRRHLRSPPSLLCGYTACWQLGAARRAGLSGSASRSAPSPLSRLKAQPLDGHFAPTAPARAALFKPNLQLRNSKSDGGTRLFGEAEKAEPWIPPAKQHNRYYSHTSPQDKGRKGAGRNQAGPGASAARGLTLK